MARSSWSNAFHPEVRSASLTCSFIYLTARTCPQGIEYGKLGGLAKQWNLDVNPGHFFFNAGFRSCDYTLGYVMFRKRHFDGIEVCLAKLPSHHLVWSAIQSGQRFRVNLKSVKNKFSCSWSHSIAYKYFENKGYISKLSFHSRQSVYFSDFTFFILYRK